MFPLIKVETCCFSRRGHFGSLLGLAFLLSLLSPRLGPRSLRTFSVPHPATPLDTYTLPSRAPCPEARAGRRVHTGLALTCYRGGGEWGRVGNWGTVTFKCIFAVCRGFRWSRLCRELGAGRWSFCERPPKTCPQGMGRKGPGRPGRRVGGGAGRGKLPGATGSGLGRGRLAFR